MRREGRVTGHVRGRRSSSAEKHQFEHYLQDLGFSGPLNLIDTHPRIKISHKPTNQSKDSGRCRLKGCHNCHARPPSKALSKTKGRNKLWTSEFRTSLRTRKPHPSLCDLAAYHAYSDPCDASTDEDEGVVDGYDVDYDELDVHGHVHVSSRNEMVSSHGDGCSTDVPSAYEDRCVDRLLMNDGHDNGCGPSSVSLSGHDNFDAAIILHPDQTKAAAICTHNHYDDFVVVYADCDGAPPVSQSLSPSDGDGSIILSQVERSKVEFADDDWIMC